MNKKMKTVVKRKLLIVMAITIVGLLLHNPVMLSQDYTSYHSYDAMTKDLKSMVDANKSIAKIESIGKTLGGRDLWVVTIGNRVGTPLDERPGMFIGANFEGDHVIGSEISLSIISYLLNNYRSVEAVKKSIDEHVYYIIPRMNPDGAEQMFSNPKTGSKTNLSQYDSDNDGRMDEDGPEDLNKDGFITMMRVKDEKGLYMIDQDEPRLLKKADPKKGESGVYSVYWEGIDNDNDGFINEDPAGGVDINRNFMHDYPYFKEDAGWHMVSEKESIALMSWIIKNRNIAIMLNFGESDNLINPPDAKGKLSSDRGLDMVKFVNESYSDAGKVGIISTGGGRYGGMYRMFGGQGQQDASTGRRRASRSAETTFGTADLDYFRKAGEKYKELTAIKTLPPLRDPKGSFFQYGYFQFGILSFITPGWGIDSGDASNINVRAPGGQRSGAEGAVRTMSGRASASGGQQGRGIDQDFIAYLDKRNVDGFVEWENFNHPEFGEVEIGGFTPYEINNPPASEIAELGKAHGEFAVWLSGLYANVEIVKTEIVNHGGGIFRIKAEIENNGFLPTSLSQGVTSRSVKPTMVQLGVDPKTIISGNAKTSFFQALPGSGNMRKYEWLINGKSGDKIELKVVAQKAGTDKVTVTLK